MNLQFFYFQVQFLEGKGKTVPLLTNNGWGCDVTSIRS